MSKLEEPCDPALIGKAGEALVAAEPLRRGVHVAYPAYDGGVDLLAYREDDFKHVVPIQVKRDLRPATTFKSTGFALTS